MFMQLTPKLWPSDILRYTRIEYSILIGQLRYTAIINWRYFYLATFSVVVKMAPEDFKINITVPFQCRIFAKPYFISILRLKWKEPPRTLILL